MTADPSTPARLREPLPSWVYDVVIELQKWHDFHPKLQAEFYDQEHGDFRLKPVDDCGCKPLDHVPDQVKAEARVVAAYVEHNPRWVVGLGNEEKA